MKIISNHHWRPFLFRYEVPDKVLQNEFDWTDSKDGFLQYRGIWYHINDFLVVEPEGELEKMGWNGIATNSYFSAVVIAISPDGETYKVGVALW